MCDNCTAASCDNRCNVNLELAKTVISAEWGKVKDCEFNVYEVENGTSVHIFEWSATWRTWLGERSGGWRAALMPAFDENNKLNNYTIIEIERLD